MKRFDVDTSQLLVLLEPRKRAAWRGGSQRVRSRRRPRPGGAHVADAGAGSWPCVRVPGSWFETPEWVGVPVAMVSFFLRLKGTQTRAW